MHYRRTQATLRVNWFRVFVDLRRAGWRARQVADAIDVPRGTLLGWRDGSEPPHCDGDRLLALWCEATGRSLDAVPRISSFDWRA